MIYVRDLVYFLESIAPLEFQENYDNSGLITGNLTDAVSGVMICLDCTQEVLSEALFRDCNVIISHHPLIFSGLKKITGKNNLERTLIDAIRSHVSIYAMHTNLDNVGNGVNDKICKKLNLSETKILVPRITKNGTLIGAGMTGFLPETLTEEGFLNYLCRKMETNFVRFTHFSKNIAKIAVCGGSGSFLLNDAILAGAEAFVTSDFKYHQFFDAEEKIMIADIGHYESEKFTQELLEEFIRQEFKSLPVRQTSVNTNPVNYFCPKTD